MSTTHREVFVPFNTPSSKNSRRGAFMSKPTAQYLKLLGVKKYSSSKKEVEDYKLRINLFRQIFEDQGWVKPDKRVIIGVHFVRKSKHRFDFHNIVQIVFDLMTAHDLIEDDDMNWLIPVPYKRDGKWFTYDKTYPGAYIKIIEDTY